MWVTIVEKLFNNFLVLNCQPFPQEKENKFVSQYRSKRHSVLVVKFTFNELNITNLKVMSRKTCSCGNHRFNGHKFLKIKRSV